ncbi:hypothetical protein Glove_320g74 [Diversispora epigaea]|uniref:REJ domain-containing protein n=1 Tax=Diversispora epigaea TaxID=1348612 RepID=A0A397HNJ5_9GLOM|nr:hypothetical protein Glove_320g74 [Diversispora epigaea]
MNKKNKRNKSTSSSSLLSSSPSSSSSSSPSSSSSSESSSSSSSRSSSHSSSSSDENKSIKCLDKKSYNRIKKEVFIITNSDLYSIYQIRKELTWEVQKNDILTKLLPPLRKKINKKYKVAFADIVQMLQRRHRSQHYEYNIKIKGEDFVKKNSRRLTKNTAMSNKKKRRRRAVDSMRESGDKYIKRYPKKDLEKILDDTGVDL